MAGAGSHRTRTAVRAAASSGRVAYFLGTDSKTGSASVAVDAKGGLHIAFAQFLPTAEKPQFFYYACAADCANDGNWSGVAGGDAVNEVQLAITASGQPRLLVRSIDSAKGSHVYEYFACDRDCTHGENWDGTAIFTRWGTSTFDLFDPAHPQRSFALDPWGRPRAVYFDRNYLVEPDHYGTFYTWCDANCTRPENWKETQISTPYEYDLEAYSYASLTFTRDGAPRLAAHIDPLSFTGEQAGVYYAGCDRDCHRHENWRRVKVMERGSGDKPSWDLELNAADQPRMAVYGGPKNDRLHYAACDGDCFRQSNWRVQEVPVKVPDGYHPDLELTAAGLPRIVYVQGSGGGIGLAACDANCEAVPAVWRVADVESARALDTEYPVARPSYCDAGLWTVMSPVLALDTAGRMSLAYDAKYDTRCLYQDPARPDPPYYRFHELWRSARLVIFP